MSDTAQLIKDKLDVVDFLRQYVELKPAGKNYKANCPFHKEKTPSFMVSPERQSWHCFGSCSEGGDVIKFLMKYENLEFYDALKVLAEKAGVEIQQSGDRDFKSYNSLYKAMEAAKDFFKTNLNASPKVFAYLKERGLNDETIKEFELGLAPDASDTLTRHLLKLGYNILDIEKAGLALKTERGTYWDRFRSRVMFPIYNHFGKVAAFTGRVLPETQTARTIADNADQNISQRSPQESARSAFVPAKYINSPETPIFQKSKLLYGFHRTKNDIREASRAVVVEGQMDFLMMWQDGVKNVVASSGTALTTDHLKVLRRLADELVFSFDADEAGQNASERAIDLAGAHDFSVRLLIIDPVRGSEGSQLASASNGVEDEKLKPGSETSVASQSVPQSGTSRSSTSWKDPADIVKAKPGLIKELIGNAQSAMDYYFHRYLKPAAVDFKSKKQNLRAVLSKIKNISSPLERSHWLKELSERVKVEERVLAEEMDLLSDKITPRNLEAGAGQESTEKLTRRDLIIQRLLGITFHLKSNFQDLESHSLYLPEKYLNLYRNFFSQTPVSAQSDLAELMNAISLRFSFENQNFETENLNKELNSLLKELKIDYLKTKRQEISLLIRQLEQSGNEDSLQKALQEFETLSRELQNVV